MRLNRKNKTIRRVARWLRYMIYCLIDTSGALFIKPWLKSRRSPDFAGKEKILIIRNDNIGDLVVSTPAIAALRERFPNATINILVSFAAKDIIKNNTCLNGIYTDIDKIEHDYSIAIALYPSFTANYYTVLSGATIRAGYKAHGAGFMLTHGLPDDRSIKPRHETRSALNIAAAIGCFDKIQHPAITIDPIAAAKAREFINKTVGEKKFVTIHPGGRQPYLRWDADNFAKLADELLKKGYEIIFIASKQEQGLIGVLQNIMHGKSFSSADLTLIEQASLIKESSLFIGNISGPMHIASALNVPLVAIYGPKDNIDGPSAWSPLNKNSIIVSDQDNCRRKCDSAFCGDFNCVKNITVDSILKAVDKLLK